MQYLYKVEFAGNWGYMGTTVTASGEDDAIDRAKDHLFREALIPWDVISTSPHVEAEYLGIAEEVK